MPGSLLPARPGVVWQAQRLLEWTRLQHNAKEHQRPEKCYRDGNDQHERDSGASGCLALQLLHQTPMLERSHDQCDRAKSYQRKAEIPWSPIWKRKLFCPGEIL